MKRIVMWLVVLSTVAFAKVKPEEFTTVANVTAVKSHDETVGYHSQAPMKSGNKSFDRGYNAAAGTNAYA